MEGQPEPHRAKIIRRMTQGLLPPGYPKGWPKAKNNIRISPQPLIVTVNGKTVYARGYEDPEHNGKWRNHDYMKVLEEQAKVIEERKDEVSRVKSRSYTPDAQSEAGSEWIIVE